MGISIAKHSLVRFFFHNYSIYNIRDSAIVIWAHFQQAHFHLTGYVNTQNVYYWPAAYLRELHERPSQSDNITTWLAICADNIYSFEDGKGISVTLTSDHLVDKLKSFFEPNVNEDFQSEEIWFQRRELQKTMQDNYLKLCGNCSRTGWNRCVVVTHSSSFAWTDPLELLFTLSHSR